MRIPPCCKARVSLSCQWITEIIRQKDTISEEVLPEESYADGLTIIAKEKTTAGASGTNPMPPLNMN
ncbi:MAG TPA: hypothetical protein DCZ20_00195 [Lachnospiraceae bacterium]|nr:hypothetical protein [Lachnospiraceae bacterium]